MPRFQKSYVMLPDFLPLAPFPQSLYHIGCFNLFSGRLWPNVGKGSTGLLTRCMVCQAWRKMLPKLKLSNFHSKKGDHLEELPEDFNSIQKTHPVSTEFDYYNRYHDVIASYIFFCQARFITGEVIHFTVCPIGKNSISEFCPFQLSC